MLCINESIQEQLQIPVIGKRKIQSPDGHFIEYAIVGPIEIKYNSNRNTCSAIIIPGSQDVMISESHLRFFETDTLLIPPITPL